MIGHIVISNGQALGEGPDTVVIEYEPPQGQPVRLAVLAYTKPMIDRYVVPVKILIENDNDEEKS